MDIGTGKITNAEMRGVRHHCLDIADPNEEYSAALFAKAADAAITDIWSRGKTAVVC